MKNTVTETFNIDVPIFAFSHCRDVVAAVSKAGGFGVLGAVGHSPDALEIDLKWIEDELANTHMAWTLSFLLNMRDLMKAD